ncbi:MAG TPA: phosphatase PAP2 family protein [Candidatus Thermoplasmatota archaeon]|nr:phosphatase PAP2 family protein [Candidatus Thermoplasmatota archaeon]
MFQTEPIIYLQSLGTPWFTFLVIMITTMGSSAFLVAIIVIAIFGVDFKKGFLLFQLMLWTGLITEILKILVAFPRPDFVDNRVFNLEFGIKNTSPFSGNEPKGIFALPDKQVIKAFRLQEAFTLSPFGFPSGHVALTTALWGGTATVFNNRIIRILTPFVIVVMALSRVYLGRHFIEDVLGGAIVGLIFLVLFAYFLKSSLKDDFFKKESFELAFRRQNLLFYCFMFVIPIIFIALSLISADVAGVFLGTNVAYFLIIRKGIPDDTGSVAQRATRVFIALLLLGVSSLILGFWFKTAGATNYLQFTLIGFLKTFIPASTIWASVAICTKLDLYRRDKGSL